MKNLLFLTLCILMVLALYRGLSLNPNGHSSPLVNKPAPAFQLHALDNEGTAIITEAIFKDKITVLQFWASWCFICHNNHQFWVNHISKKNHSLENATEGIQWIGVNYHDSVEDAQSFLKKNKDPYQLNLVDDKGRMGIDYGVLGIPEMFIIDAKGIIRYHYKGTMTSEIWQTVIVPLLKNISA